MKIKHIHSDHIINLTPLEWYKNFLKSEHKVYEKYIIIDTSDVRELHSIDEKTGVIKFNMLIDKTLWDKQFSKEPRRFVLKDFDSKKFDKYLRPFVAKKNQSFLRKIWYNRPKLKTIYELIINSTISKLTSNIFSGVIIGVLILIFWALFGTGIVNYLKSLIN